MPAARARVCPEGLCVQNQWDATLIKQVARQAGCIPTVVAAAHKKPDVPARKLRLTATQHVKGGPRRIFHQNHFGQPQIHSALIPGTHFPRQGQGRKNRQRAHSALEQNDSHG